MTPMKPTERWAIVFDDGSLYVAREEGDGVRESLQRQLKTTVLCGGRVARVTITEGDGWRPIEEAPADGVPILCLDANTREIRVGIRKLFFEKSGRYEWFRDDERVPGQTWSLTPTHWMPLPTPPATSGTEEKL